jgi:hypothetical protein
MLKNLRKPWVSRQKIFEALKEYIFIAIISGILGILIALPFVILYTANLFGELTRACLTGVINGTVCRAVFVFVLRNIHSHPFWAFLSICFIMGMGTFFSSYFFGLTNPLHLFLLLSLAEAVGLALAYTIYRYSINLNRKLMETQQKIQQQTSSEKK